MELRVTKDVLHARVQDCKMVVDFGTEFAFRENGRIPGQPVLFKTVALGMQMVVDLNTYTVSVEAIQALACTHASGQTLSIRQIQVVQPSLYRPPSYVQKQKVRYAYEDGAVQVEGVECKVICLQLIQEKGLLQIGAYLA